MFLLDSVLVGPVRMLLIFLGVLLTHQIVTRQPLRTYNLDYIVNRIVIYCGVVLISVFVLIQLNMYDMFSLLLLLFILIIFVYFGLNNPFKILDGVQNKKTSFLLNFFKFIERDINIIKLFDNNKHYLYPKRINFVLLTAFGVALTTFISRYLFLKNDLYTLSDLWIENLQTVKLFNSGTWFTGSLNVKGELAFINFYAKITNISEEMAIHSFGLIESFGLALISYWLIQKITKSKFVAPMISGLFFAVFYKYLPININLVIEHNPLYFAFCFALPAMVFTVKPNILKGDDKKYFIALLILYFGVGLTSLFALFIFLPIFLVIAVVFTNKKTFNRTIKSVLAFLIAVAVVLVVHYYLSFKAMVSFQEFIITNLVQVNSYTYFPQLALSLDKLVFIYTVIGWFSTVVLFLLWLKGKSKWALALVFQLFFNCFILLRKVNTIWIDTDLYYQSLAILIVILVGIIVGIVVYLLKISMPKKPFARGVSIATFFIALLMFSYITNGYFNYKSHKTEVLKTDILQAYDKLSTDYMPYSYAVVNRLYGQSISTDTHHFINYKDFTHNYIKRDSIYQEVKDKPKILEDNPQFILPESVFVFIATNMGSESKYEIETPDETIKILRDKIKELKNKGRVVNLFYKDDFLTIYEIVNKENASKLNDLILDL